jgi:hypothetical protein
VEETQRRETGGEASECSWALHQLGVGRGFMCTREPCARQPRAPSEVRRWEAGGFLPRDHIPWRVTERAQALRGLLVVRDLRELQRVAGVQTHDVKAVGRPGGIAAYPSVAQQGSHTVV